MHILLALLLTHQVLATTRTWEDVPVPFAGPPAAFGTYSMGCIFGNEELPISTPNWEIVNNSRNRYYGHPEMVDFLDRLAAASVKQNFGKMIVGDISLPSGGKLAYGHASHQMGLDADVRFNFYPIGKTMSESVRNGWPEVDIAEMKNTSAKRWTCRVLENKYKPEYMALVRLAALDPMVNRIFVSPALKVRLCDLYDSSSHPKWLLKVRPYTGHTAHFHVRLECPEDSPGCSPQPLTSDPTDPTGVGCAGNSLHWWLTGEELVPDPNPPQPPPPLDLPAVCVNTLKDLRIVKLNAQIRCSALVKNGKTYLGCHDYHKNRNFNAVSTCTPTDIEHRPTTCVTIP